MGDDVITRIAQFESPRGSLVAERRSRGCTLYDARSDAPVTRLRPAKPDGYFEVLYWSSWKERWSPTGPSGSTSLTLDDALARIAAQDIF